MRVLLVILSCLFVGSVLSQSKEKLVRSGNKLYADKQFNEAEISYLKSLEKDEHYYKGLMNLGDAYYRQGNYEDATKTFMKLAQQDVDKQIRANAYHNLGNALVQSKKYKEGIEAYKHALRNNPADQDTKYNLEYARRLMQQQQQQQQQQQNDQNEDKKEQDQQQQQQQNQQKDEQGEQREQQQGQQQEQNEKGQQEKPREGQMSKKDAERMLNAMKDNEQKVQEKVNQQMKGVPVYIEKDW